MNLLRFYSLHSVSERQLNAKTKLKLIATDPKKFRFHLIESFFLFIVSSPSVKNDTNQMRCEMSSFSSFGKIRRALLMKEVFLIMCGVFAGKNETTS